MLIRARVKATTRPRTTISALTASLVRDRRRKYTCPSDHERAAEIRHPEPESGRSRMQVRASRLRRARSQRDCRTGHSVLRGGDNRSHDGNQETKCRNRRIDCDPATGCRRISDRDRCHQRHEAEEYDYKGRSRRRVTRHRQSARGSAPRRGQRLRRPGSKAALYVHHRSHAARFFVRVASNLGERNRAGSVGNQKERQNQSDNKCDLG